MALEKKFIGRRGFVAGALATSAIAALSACGKKGDPAPAAPAGDEKAPAEEGKQPAAQESGAATQGGTLKIYRTNPASIDPFNAQEDQGISVVYALFDTLTNFDFEAGELKPLACESWEANEYATQFTFHLIDGAKFHNGDPVTAQDFKYAWERICNPKTTDSPSVIAYHLAPVKGYDEMVAGQADALDIECPDDLTLVVNLSASYADFPYVVSHPALSPVPSGGAAEDFQKFFLAPVGNGAFKMDGEWVDGQYIKVVRNEDYHGEKPLIDGIDFMIFKDLQTAFTEFEAGNIDITDIPTGRIGELSQRYGVSDDGYVANPGKQVINGEETSTYYLAVNCQDPAVEDKLVRQGLSLAINRQAISDTLFEGSRVPADGIVPPGIDGYKEGAWEYSKYDVEAAKAKLDEAGLKEEGGKRDLNITLVCNSGSGHEDIMQLIQSDFEKIGVAADIQTQEWAAYLDALQNGDYQIGRLGWVADYPIMDNFLFPLFFTGAGDNRSQYSNPEVDDLMNKARQTVDAAERIALFQEADKMIAEDMPLIPVMFYRHTQIASRRVNNLYFGPTKLMNFNKVWLSE
ncbi:MAG: ABC transporter substrate-binding protein [Coriobacteriia bacterium]|nr:ABC transporter substrate-binding protein [Coriobacteriia bacterium]